MLASQLMDGSRMFIEMVKDRDNFHALLEVLTESCITLQTGCLMQEQTVHLLRTPAALRIFSVWNGKGIWFSVPKKLYSHIQDNGGYVISHNCANHAFYELEMALELML
jgi:uroporphyrinogen decarboxylase